MTTRPSSARVVVALEVANQKPINIVAVMKPCSKLAGTNRLVGVTIILVSLIVVSSTEPIELKKSGGLIGSQRFDNFEEGELWKSRSGNQHKNEEAVVRQKRQTPLLSCPVETMVEPDNHRTSVLIYSPKQRIDIRINYGNTSWPKNEMKKLLKEGFNLTAPTFIYLHAFTQHPESPWLMEVRRLYDEMFPPSAQNQTFNLLLLDWSSFSRQRYNVAVTWVPHVGRALGRFLRTLVDRFNYDMKNVHLVSFSLSAHVAGLASREVRSATGLEVAKITALDPTGVCFQDNSTISVKYALRPTDAKLVLARHYDLNGFGSTRPIGGIDIFINGGNDQPLKGLIKREAIFPIYGSSHSYAVEHETRMVLLGQCQEVAYECSSYAAFLMGECADCGKDNEKCIYINTLGQIQLSDKGIKIEPTKGYPTNTTMYIKTGLDPVCMHHYQIVIKLNSNATDTTRQLLTSGSVTLELGPKIQVQPKNQLNEKYFTVLLVSDELLPPVENATLSVRTPNTETVVPDLLTQVKYVIINYMSNIEAEVRASQSAKLCLDPATQTFVKC